MSDLAKSCVGLSYRSPLKNAQPGPYHEDELELRLRTLTELSLLALLRLEDEMVMPPEMKFSRRELEILKWTAEGRDLGRGGDDIV